MRLKRLFARLRNIETGGEGMSGGGEAPDAITTDTSIDAGTPAADHSDADAGPKSLLEAIEQGLKQPETPEGEKTAAERARDEQGRFAKQEQAKAEGELKPPKEGEKQPGEQADEFAMPEGLSAKAQERFQTLVSKVKEREQALEAVTNDLEGFRTVIRETGASPQDFGQALDYMRMVSSGDLQGALRVLDAQRQQIALALGQPLPGADPLQGFPDLRQRVDAYQMDEATAIELARSRHVQQRQQSMQQQERQSIQAQQSAQAARQSAVAQIDQLGAQWARTDPDFAAKEEIILKQLPAIAKQFPPTMWAQQVQILYDTISAMPRPAPQRTAPPPLRSSGQTAGNRQPANMLEAITSGLGYSGG